MNTSTVHKICHVIYLFDIFFLFSFSLLPLEFVTGVYHECVAISVSA